MTRARMTRQGLGLGSTANCVDWAVDWASTSFDVQRGRDINESGWCR